jgi:hypothetical protein
MKRMHMTGIFGLLLGSVVVAQAPQTESPAAIQGIVGAGVNRSAFSGCRSSSWTGGSKDTQAGAFRDRPPQMNLGVLH